MKLNALLLFTGFVLTLALEWYSGVNFCIRSIPNALLIVLAVLMGVVGFHLLENDEY